MSKYNYLELFEQFKGKTLEKAEWTHNAHLIVGLCAVQFYPENALAFMRVGIKELNLSHGTQNTESSGYHETITVFYIRLIESILNRHSNLTFDAQIDLLINQYGSSDLVLKYYSRELIFSSEARAKYIEPDLRRFDF